MPNEMITDMSGLSMQAQRLKCLPFPWVLQGTFEASHPDLTLVFWFCTPLLDPKLPDVHTPRLNYSPLTKIPQFHVLFVFHF